MRRQDAALKALGALGAARVEEGNQCAGIKDDSGVLQRGQRGSRVTTERRSCLHAGADENGVERIALVGT